MRVVVLAIGDPYEHPHGGTLRTRAFLKALVELGHEVTCVHPAPAVGVPDPGVRVVPVHTPGVGGRSWPGWVRQVKRALLPMPTMTGGRSAGTASALASLGEADLLLVSQLPGAAQLPHLQSARLFLDHSDLWSDFIRHEVARSRGLPRLTAAMQQRHLSRLEDDLTRSAVVSSAAGWLDAQTLQGRSGRPVLWLPTPVAPVRSAPVSTTPRNRPTAGFLANFGFWPNVAAAELLAKVWAPLLHRNGWEVLVAGLGSKELTLPDYVRNVGPIPSVSDFYDLVDVTLAPITLGGGMKVKVVESLVHGRPVVGTALAGEGFPPNVRRLIYEVDADSPDFAVLHDGAPPLADAGRALEPFTQGGFTRRLRSALDAVAP